MKLIMLIFCFLPFTLLAQSKKQKKLLAAQLKEDQKIVTKIAEQYAAISNIQSQDTLTSYIENELTVAGLEPFQSSSLVQNIQKDEGKVIEPTTYLTVNGNALTLFTDYFPMPFSAEQKIKGMPAIALREKKQPWFIDYQTLQEGTANVAPTHKIIKEAHRAAAKGATALFLYNGTDENLMHYNAKDTNSVVPIPVVYISPKASKQYFSDASDIVDIELNVIMMRKVFSEKYIVGLINNQSSKSVIIQADMPTAQSKMSDSAFVNPIDAALLLQLVKTLQSEKYKFSNYLLRLVIRDNEFTTATSNPIDYAIILKNCILSDSDSTINLYGIQSSDSWRNIVSQLTADKILLFIDSTNHFYNLLSGNKAFNYPYLLFSTQQKSINVQSLLYADLIKYILKIIEKTASFSPIVNIQEVNTKNATTTTTVTNIQDTVIKSGIMPKTKVSLGIVSDKTYTGEGIKIKSVVPKKTAAQIGLQPGDILTHLGNNRIQNFKSYLQILSFFNPGDKAELQLLRGGAMEKKEVNF